MVCCGEMHLNVEHAGPNARSRYDTRGFRTLGFDINGGSPGRYGDQRRPCSALLGRYHLEMRFSHIIHVKKNEEAGSVA